MSRFSVLTDLFPSDRVKNLKVLAHLHTYFPPKLSLVSAMCPINRGRFSCRVENHSSHSVSFLISVIMKRECWLARKVCGDSHWLLGSIQELIQPKFHQGFLQMAAVQENKSTAKLAVLQVAIHTSWTLNTVKLVEFFLPCVLPFVAIP